MRMVESLLGHEHGVYGSMGFQQVGFADGEGGQHSHSHQSIRGDND